MLMVPVIVEVAVDVLFLDICVCNFDVIFVCLFVCFNVSSFMGKHLLLSSWECQNTA